MISINLKSSQLTAERKLCTAARADFSALVNINLRSAQSSRINPMHSLWKFIGEEFKCLDFTTLKTMIMNQETEIPIKCLPLSLLWAPAGLFCLFITTFPSNALWVSRFQNSIRIKPCSKEIYTPGVKWCTTQTCKLLIKQQVKFMFYFLPCPLSPNCSEQMAAPPRAWFYQRPFPVKREFFLPADARFWL